MHGWLNIYKPRLFTSTAIVNKIKYILKRELGQVLKVGHAGTLDPLAEGVLPIAIGQATKLMPFLVEQSKKYLFTVQFGANTDTGDQAGTVLQTTINYPDEQSVHKVCQQFLGKILQTPPQFSALKVNGVRAYKLARAGQDFLLPQRQIEIYSLVCTEYSQIDKTATFLVHCSKGTYIRSLAIDLASALQTLGFVIKLIRTAVGSFMLDESISLEQKLSVKPLAVVLSDIIEVPLDKSLAQKVRYGQKVTLNAPNGLVRLSYEEQLLAIGKVEQGIFTSQRVFDTEI